MLFKKHLFLYLLTLFACSMPLYAQTPIVVDDAGNTLQLAAPAQRIISLAPDLTEILFALGAEKHLVGVLKGSDYPPAAKQIVEVGSFTGLDLERILRLRPDLIVVWGLSFRKQTQILKKLGLPIYVAIPKQLSDVSKTLVNFGKLTGFEQNAANMTLSYNQGLQELQKKYQNQSLVRVFYQIGGYGLLTINKESWINQAIAMCGGKNIFADAVTLTPEVTWEAVLHLNPQVILTDTQQEDWKKRWQTWPTIAAVKRNTLFAIDPNIIDRAGPRLLKGVQIICQKIDQYRLKTS